MATVMSGAAIAPALGVIAKAFPEATPTMIKMILTAPALAIIPFTFLTSYLTTILPKRNIALIGLVAFLIGGVTPQFMPSIEWIIFFRLILGAGVGVLMPLSQSLIYDHFTGKERTRMMGFNSAFSNLGGIVTMLIAGWLATFGWQLPFYVYLLGTLVFILIFFFLPKGEIQKPQPNEKRAKIPMAIYGYALALGGIMLSYYAVAINIAIYLEQNNLGGPVLAGTVVSLTTFGGMITSFFLVQIMSVLKQYIIPVMLLCMGGAFLILSMTNTVALVMVSVCLIGFAQGSLFPVITIKALNRVKTHQTDKSIAIITSFIFIGQFLSPVVLDLISKIANQTVVRFQFGALSLMILISMVVLFFRTWNMPVTQLQKSK